MRVSLIMIFLDEKHILFVLLLNVYLGLSPQAKTRRCIFVVLAFSLFKRMTWSWFTHHRSASGYGWCNKCQLWLRQRHKLRNQWYWLIYKGSVKPGQKKPYKWTNKLTSIDEACHSPIYRRRTFTELNKPPVSRHHHNYQIETSDFLQKLHPSRSWSLSVLTSCSSCRVNYVKS